MCLPTDHDSILTLLQQMRELGFQATLLDERKPCVLCKPDDPCWWHSNFEERCNAKKNDS